MSLAWTRLPWQSELWTVLRPKAQSAGHHALLIHGPEGIGKERLARALVASYLCDLPEADLSACGHCPSCEWLNQGHHPDFRELTTPSRRRVPAGSEDEDTTTEKKASEQIGIEDIRALSSFMSVTTHRGGVRVILIQPADALNTAAANALLKTLEEPLPGTKFILVTSNPERLPATIRSRCLPVAHPLPSRLQALHWLRESGVEDAERLLDRFGGRPLSAYSASEMGLEDEETFIQALLKIRSNPFSLSEKAAKETLQDWVKWLLAWCHDLLSKQASGQVRFFKPHERRIAELAASMAPMALLEWESMLRQALRRSTEPVNPKLMMDELLMGYVELLKHSTDK